MVTVLCMFGGVDCIALMVLIAKLRRVSAADRVDAVVH